MKLIEMTEKQRSTELRLKSIKEDKDYTNMIKKEDIRLKNLSKDLQLERFKQI